ncbi:hypothetical protein GCM10020367_67300 [Streptomyces sannanensis]|uniref:Probable transposase IS891/IS1136/IS1341 domain-containing protein n=1 Tax=Streptomyces sannanensis TaxID=285536 RepID=A0ABP6SMV0_9ACTN
MKLVVQVKLLPTPVQATALEATLRACNEAATWASRVAFDKDVKRNFALREHTYGEIKARWGLGAQAAQHVIKKTCDAYAVLRANLKAGNLGRPGSKRYRKATGEPIVFRPEGAQPYDDRMLSWQIAGRRVSIWTVAGRVKDVAFTAGPEQLATLALYRRGESDLVCRDGMWFLNATCEVPEPPPDSDPVDFLGIDLGIVNIATTSDGEIMAGRELNRSRVRERKLRAKLQKKNTPSAKRRLNKRGRKEARRAKDINHKIAKHVVAEAMGVPPCSNEVESLGEHRSRDRPGGPDGHPRAGTASQAPTGHPPQLVVRPAGGVHRHGHDRRHRGGTVPRPRRHRLLTGAVALGEGDGLGRGRPHGRGRRRPTVHDHPVVGRRPGARRAGAGPGGGRPGRSGSGRPRRRSRTAWRVRRVPSRWERDSRYRPGVSGTGASGARLRRRRSNAGRRRFRAVSRTDMRGVVGGQRAIRSVRRNH